MIPRARGRRSVTIVMLVLVVGAGLGFRHWSSIHLGKVTRTGRPVLTSCLTCHGPGASKIPPRPQGEHYPSPVALALAPDGSRVFVSSDATDEIVLVDPTAGLVTERWTVGSDPHGIALDGQRHVLYVALRAEDRVAALDLENGEEIGTVKVGRLPRGLALDPKGQTLIVANSGSNDISLVECETLTERCRLVAGREPYAVSVNFEGTLAYVANRMAELASHPALPESEVTVVDLKQGRVQHRAKILSGHLSEGIAVGEKDALAFLSLVRVRNLVPITQVAQGWVMSSALGVVLPGQHEVVQLPLDEVNAYFADPSDVAVDENRGRIFVASGGGDCVSVLDLDLVRRLATEARGAGEGPWADHLGISSEYVLARIPVAANPRGLLLDPDRSRLFVAERLGSSIALVDTETLELERTIALGQPRDLDKVRRGEILFHRAAITFQSQFSCRSCHPDGHVDGLAYDFAIDGMGKNILDNRSLLGLAGTAPFKWNGKNEDLFEQCGPRFARVLTRSDPFPPEDLDCLVTYILSLPPPSHGNGATLTPVQARGREIFARTMTNEGEEIPTDSRCTTCHPPPLFTNRMLQSVGTRSLTDTVEEFDAAHLLGIGDSAPYLHDGRAATLEEIWTVHSPDDKHGVVNDLSKEQLNALVEYLRTL